MTRRTNATKDMLFVCMPQNMSLADRLEAAAKRSRISPLKLTQAYEERSNG